MDDNPYPAANKDSQLYGAGATGRSTTFREKLTDLFSATDFVRVQNIDNEPFSWQVLLQKSETHDFNTGQSSVPQKTTYRDRPEVYTIDPGKSMVIQGESAYLMIEGLYKKLVSKKVVMDSPKMAPGQARNFNFSDDSAQDKYIELIYLGKENPRFDDFETAPKEDIIKQVDEDLEGEITPTPVRRGRPPKSVQGA